MQINQLNQSNSNNGIVADMLHRGLVTGDFKLASDDVRSTILALTKSIIMVNEDIHNAKQANLPYSSPNFRSTGDNSGKAQELSSHHRVSRIGEGVVNESDVTKNPIPRKRRSYANDASSANDNQSRKKKSFTKLVDSLPDSILATTDEVFSYMHHGTNDAVSYFLHKYKDSGEYTNIGMIVYYCISHSKQNTKQVQMLYST
jgi:hypothetical protein